MSEFNSPFSVQIISLKNTIRSKTLESKLNEFGLRFQISPGVVPKEIDFHNGLLHSAFLSKLIGQRNLVRAEIGCALAHRNAASNFLDSDNKFGLIFEDDAEVIAEFDFDIVKKALDSTSPRLMVFGWRPGFALTNNTKVLSSVEPNQLISPPLGAFAYALNRPAAKLIIGAGEKIIDIADWPIHVLNKLTFYSPTLPWIDPSSYDEEITTIPGRIYLNPNSRVSILAIRIRLVVSLLTLMILSKTNKLDVSPKQIIHRLLIQPMLYEYGLNQVDKESPTNEVIPLPSTFKKFGLVPSRWTRT